MYSKRVTTLLQILLFLILFQQDIYSQELRLGGSLDISFGVNDAEYEYGPNLIFIYSPDLVPIDFRFDSHLYISETNSGFSNTGPNVGMQLLFNPINWAIEPYIGIGLRYNFNQLSSKENSLIRLVSVEDDISFEFIGGIVFSANTPINFLMEMLYSNHNIPYTFASNSEPGESIIKSELRLESIYLRLGLLVNL